MLKYFKILLLFSLVLLIISCTGNDFHYDPTTQSIVSNHDGFRNLSVEIEGPKNNYIAGCEIGSRSSDNISIKNLELLPAVSDSDCSKSIFKPNTILIIKNSGGDAGPYSLKLFIDSAKQIKELP